MATTRPALQLYERIGRRYVPWGNRIDWGDTMRAGQFRLSYAYGEGGTRYEYEVTPDTAGFVAASMLAMHAMCEAMREAARHRPMQDRAYTKAQLAACQQARDILESAGVILPVYWDKDGPDAIARAGVDAVRNWRP